MQRSTRSTVMCCVGTVKKWLSSPSHRAAKQRASRDAGCCCTQYSLHTLCKTGCISPRRSALRCAAGGSRGGCSRNREASFASDAVRSTLSHHYALPSRYMPNNPLAVAWIEAAKRLGVPFVAVAAGTSSSTLADR